MLGVRQGYGAIKMFLFMARCHIVVTEGMETIHISAVCPEESASGILVVGDIFGRNMSPAIIGGF